MLYQDVLSFTLFAIGLVLSISIHECSHAYSLFFFGDRSLRTLHRLSLRPDLHFKWWGYLLLLVTGLIIGNPVIIDPDEVGFKYNYDLVLIVTKLAGPASNLISAIVSLLVLSYIEGYPNLESSDMYLWTYLLEWFSYINLFLFVFNMIPIPLLDGGVFLLVLGLKLEIEIPVAIVSFAGVIGLLIGFYAFPETSVIEFIVDIPGLINEWFMLHIVGHG